MVELVAKNFWWPGVTKEVKKYVEGCNACQCNKNCVINFIWLYLHQFFDDSHSLKGYKKPLKRPFDRCQSCLEAINIGQDIKQIN